MSKVGEYYEELRERGGRDEIGCYKNQSPLPVTKTKEDKPTVSDYWSSFIALTYAIGSYSHTVKLGRNANEGIYPTQVVRHDYYQGSDANIEQAIECCRLEVWRSIRAFNKTAKAVGMPQFADDDARRFVRWMCNGDRLESFRRMAERRQKKGAQVPISDLIDGYLKRHPDAAHKGSCN